MPYIKKTSGKRAPAKRKLAEVFAPGEVLTDTSKKEWKLGVPIGQGGFGRLYLGKSGYLWWYFKMESEMFILVQNNDKLTQSIFNRCF